MRSSVTTPSSSRPLRSRQAMSITRPAFPMPSDPFVPELPPLYLEDVRLRLAEEADYAFLRALYRQVRAAELAPVPWSEAEKHAFCDSQFALQDQHYRKHYAHSALDRKSTRLNSSHLVISYAVFCLK